MRKLLKTLRLFVAFGLIVCTVGALVISQTVGWNILEWPPSGQSDRTAWVDTDAVNVRAGPSTDAEVLGVLPLGTRITITGSNRNGFAPVTFNGTTAWMYDAYLSSYDHDRIDVPPVTNVAHAAEPVEVVQAPGPMEPESDDTPRSDPPVVRVPETPSGEHWIDVDRGLATITLSIGDTPLLSFSGKIGRDPSDDGFYSTAVGTFHVYTMNPGLSSTPFVDDVYMTDFVGFDPDRHNGFHSPIRDRTGAILPSQNPTTLGCIRLEEAAAVSVFDFAVIGMRVEIHN